jgi:hypothetical protein
MLSIRSLIDKTGIGAALVTVLILSGGCQTDDTVILKELVKGEIKVAVPCDKCKDVNTPNCTCADFEVREEYPAKATLDNADRILSKKGYKKAKPFEWTSQEATIQGSQTCRRMMQGKWIKGEKMVNVQIYYEMDAGVHGRCRDDEFKSNIMRIGFYTE